MRDTRAGFTLSELLIVVLGIGILTAVAVPGYAKVVEGTRKREGQYVLGLIRSAELRFHVEQDAFTAKLTDLDIENPNADSRFFDYGIRWANETDFCAAATRRGGPYTLTINRRAELGEVAVGIPSAAPSCP